MLHSAIKELSKKMKEMYDQQQSIGAPIFRPGYINYPLTAEAFIPIKNVNSNRQIAFIDGGNIELLGAPNFSIHLNRIYFNIFHGTQRVLPKHLPQTIEYFSFTSAIAVEREIYYETILIPLLPEHAQYLPSDADLRFNSFDRQLTNQVHRANISTMANVPRRFAEWKMTQLICENELNPDDIIVMDGLLTVGYPNERKYSQTTLESAFNHRVILTALAKSSHTYTSTGLGLVSTVAELSKQTQFPLWYIPIAEGQGKVHEAKIYITKLHETARTPYRFEIYARQLKVMSAQDEHDIFAHIAFHASDGTMLGYPYGLIDADHRARVQYEEIDRYKMMILAEMSKDPIRWQNIMRDVGGIESHEILNELVNND